MADRNIMSPAERSRRYREKNKMEVEFKARNQSKCRKYRRSLSETSKERIRALTKIRVRNYRQRVASAQRLIEDEEAEPIASTSHSPYSCRQSYAKAMLKVTRSLPYSPRKKQAIVTALATNAGLAVKSIVHKQHSHKVTEDVKAAIKAFYQSDEISRHLAGKKETMVVRDAEGKRTVSKRVLMNNLKETYLLFCNEHKDIKVGLTTFCELRPAHVQPVNSKSQEVCCCPHCENPQILFRSVTWSNIDGKNPKNLSELVALVVCDPDDEQCMKRKCNKCPISTEIETFLFECIDDDRELIPAKQWKQGILSVEHYSKSDICDKLSEQLNKYIPHIYNVKAQAKSFTNDKKNIKEGEIILQIDFAENYTIKHQNEISAAHFMPSAGNKVTIFTAVAYFINPDTENQDHRSYAVISDTPHHTSLEVQVFCNKIFDNLKQDINIQKVSFWTDGAVQHFKNRSTMAALSFYPEIHNFDAVWNFSESYHGKGAHDGIGGVLKFCVWRRVLQGKATITNAKEFYEVAKSFAEKTILSYVPLNKIQEEKPHYEKIWNKCKAASAIQQCRLIKPVARYRLAMFKNSHDKDPFINCNIEPAPESDDSDAESLQSMESFSSHEEPQVQSVGEENTVSAVGDYVIVSYVRKGIKKYYIANIENVYDDDEVSVKLMRRVGVDRANNLMFQYPLEDDRDTLSTEQIVKNLPQPSIHRMTYSWPGITFPEPMF
jgi:hypothetical protein